MRASGCFPVFVEKYPLEPKKQNDKIYIEVVVWNMFIEYKTFAAGLKTIGEQHVNV